MGQLYILLALAIGLFLPIQVGINTELAQRISSPITASLFSFAVGTISLMVCLFIFRDPWPDLNTLTTIPKWLWLGGLIGAFAVFGSIISGPKIGLLSLVAFVLAGQLLASLILDHYGWLGFPVRELSLGRISGSTLLLISVVLIHKY
jgi:transporter family-2 protein